MEIAKISGKGQVTLPIELRRALNLNAGDKVAFLKEGEKYVLVNSSVLAIQTAQKAFAGEAESAELQSEDDVVRLVKEVRALK